jgi:hypothetical protein
MAFARRAVAAASLAVLGAGGLALVGASAATATAGATSTLECTPGTTGSGQSTMTCDATAGAGLRSIRVTDNTFGHSFTASSSQDCSSGSTTGTITFPTFFSDRYKVVVTDCEHPGAKDVYRVFPDGTVTLISSTGGGTA